MVSLFSDERDSLTDSARFSNFVQSRVLQCLNFSLTLLISVLRRCLYLFYARKFFLFCGHFNL